MFSIFLVFLLVHVCRAADQLNVQISGKRVSDNVPPNFVGHSIEVPDTPKMLGRYPSPPRQSFVNLLNNLRLKSGGPFPTIRIGGNSADTSWWNPKGLPNPPRVTYSITEADFKTYFAFSDLTLKQSGGKHRLRFIPDSDSRQAYNASQTVEYLVAMEKFLAGRSWKDYFVAVEIGNEPDLFYFHHIRNFTWTFQDYLKNQQDYINKIYKTVKTFPPKFIEGGTWAGPGLWQYWNPLVEEYTAKFKDYLADFCVHEYPRFRCFDFKPTIKELLDDFSSEWEPRRVAQIRNDSHGLPVVVGESNSVACGGQPGVSDTMAATLWSIDFMFNLVAGNAKRINFHGGPTGPYAPIRYYNSSNPADPPTVMPLYYGMLAFAEATANDSYVVEAKVTTSNHLIKAWTVNGKPGLRVMVIHKDYSVTDAVVVTVVPPKGAKAGVAAKVARLSAPGIKATKGLKWAGQTFDNSHDGLPVGERVLEQVPFDHSAKGWKFDVKPSTAALLYLPS